MDTVFAASRLDYKGCVFFTARRRGKDVIVTRGPLPAEIPLKDGQSHGGETVFPANYENMLAWERVLAPRRCLIAVNRSGHPCGFGAGNRMVIAQADLPYLSDTRTMAGWDGIYAALKRSAVPFWFIQQSIVRELIPEGVDPALYPGIGHTGGYGPREFLRAGLFAFASLGGYRDDIPPIGADADHAIVVGYDEESLQRSIAFNKLAMEEALDYTKFTVDTSHLFDFPVTLTAADERRLRAAFAGRTFVIKNIVPGRPSLSFAFADEEIIRLGKKYWTSALVHKVLYDHACALCRGRAFDYELSLDETPEPTPPQDLLFYMVLLYEVMDVPSGSVASAGPNIGFIKRHDYEGTLQELDRQVNACASVLEHFGAMLSVHSADGVRAKTGKGPGCDLVIQAATCGRVELKVADVYQEVLWQVLAASPEKAERDLFLEAWRRTYDAAATLGVLYVRELEGKETRDVQRMLATEAERARLVQQYGQEAVHLAQGTIGYGLPVFRLAAELTPRTDPARPDPNNELFRRFMFLTYRTLRPAVFQVMSHEGWQRLAVAVEEATMVRLRDMRWTRD